jgi:hypothetical protein
VRQVAFGVGCVLPAANVVGDEREIVADEDFGAEGDADQEGFVVAVSEANGVSRS